MSQQNEIARALSKAQGQMPPADLTGYNDHRKYKYAKLSDIVETARGPLADNGLSVSQVFEDDPEGGPQVLRTILLHESGQQLESRLRLLPVGDYHALGSATTYSRKYALAALLNIVAQEDDDGEAAMAKPGRPSAGAKARPGRKPKAKLPQTPDEKWVEALAIIDRVEGAREMFAAKDIDCRELLPQVVDQVIKHGDEGMAKKVAEWKKELAKEEAAAEKAEQEKGAAS
jgi:hypothetical protein